jgi:hypothetical protein
MKIAKLFLVVLLLVVLSFSPMIQLEATMDWSKYKHQHFFAFNKALLKNDMDLQKRGVVTVKRISFAVSQVPEFQVNALIEPALSFEDYTKKPVPMKVSQKLVFGQLNRYQQELNHQDTFILYSHTHGVKNNFKDGEEWGGIILDINGVTLPHQGVTIWSDYSDELLDIPAKNVIVLVMACYSGGLIDYLKTIEAKWKNRAETGRNFLVITSQNNSSTSDPVPINGELYNPFSAAVETALLGKADGFKTGLTDGQVTYEEFVGYIMETTHQLSSRAFPQTLGSYDPGEVLFSYR